MTVPRGWAAGLIRGALAVAGLTGGGEACVARVLEVGPGQALATPSEAAAVADDGDVVTIAPGTYFDCAVWRANRLTITASAPGVLVTDRACAGKAAFVVLGDGVVIRGIGFARLRVEDGNGAGIRAEGRDLTVRDSLFVNDQAGIISAAASGFLHIEGCGFEEIGTAGTEQPRAVIAGPIDELRVSGSVFRHDRGGGFIASSARVTALRDNQIGDEEGRTAAPLVRVDGGSVLVEGNAVTLAPEPVDRPGVVLVRGDARDITVRDNTLIEPFGHVPLLRNWSGAAAVETGNMVPPGIAAVSDSGAVYHRMRYRAAQARRAAGDAARLVRHQVAELARGLRLIR